MEKISKTFLNSKKRPIEPMYEEVDEQPSFLKTSSFKRQKIDEPQKVMIEENKDEVNEEDCSEEDEENMSPRLLSDMIAETTPRPSES